jgi:hypothetical protein
MNHKLSLFFIIFLSKLRKKRLTFIILHCIFIHSFVQLREAQNNKNENLNSN